MRRPAMSSAAPRRPWLALTGWLVVGAAMAALYLASDRALSIDAGVKISDKLLHFGAYALLAALWLAALRATWPAAGRRGQAWLAALAATAYGATDEWHQSFVVGRVADPWDWVADAAGAATVALLVTVWVTTTTRRGQSQDSA